MISAGATARDSLLFVYGTLRAFVGSAAGDRMRRHACLIGCARVRGRLYDLGRYPGLAPPRRAGDWVTGEVYRLRNPWPTLRALDVYEAGARFVRERSLADLASGTRRRVWVYRFIGPVHSECLIGSGDYETDRLRSRGGKPTHADSRPRVTE
jgi:gamma-glutamylcyclotransferase (GGCT)/AIG2-like uncharacterized protein YtfP